jgi:hypothetical protein
MQTGRLLGLTLLQLHGYGVPATIPFVVRRGGFCSSTFCYPAVPPRGDAPRELAQTGAASWPLPLYALSVYLSEKYNNNLGPSVVEL